MIAFVVNERLGCGAKLLLTPGLDSFSVHVYSVDCVDGIMFSDRFYSMVVIEIIGAVANGYSWLMLEKRLTDIRDNACPFCTSMLGYELDEVTGWSKCKKCGGV